jgi:hypothetical protein
MALLSSVEVQLCVQMLDLKSICALAKCNRSLKKDAENRFALATQDPIVVASHKLAPDRANIAAGLLQYHPKIEVKGPWKTLKRLPDAIVCNVVNLDIRNPLGLAKGLEATLISMSRLKVLQLFDRPAVKSSTAVRLFRALGERERVAGATGLRSLKIANWSLGVEAMGALAVYVAGATSLKELVLYGHTYKHKKDNLGILADGFVLNRSIKTLDLKFAPLSWLGWLGRQPEVALSKILRGCPSLTSLNLFGTAFGNDNQHYQLTALVDAVMDDNCNLQSLNFAHCNLDSRSARALAPMIAKVHILDLANNAIGQSGFDAMGEVIKVSKTITHFNLSNNSRIVRGLERFSSNLAVNKSLQVLELDSCMIESFMLLVLKLALVGKVELRELSLYNNHIDNSANQYIAEILVGCPSLEVFQIGKNRIGSLGMRAIAAVLPQAKNLQRLGLEWNGVVDDASAAVLFTAIHGNPSLTYVSIGDEDDEFHIGELATPVLASLKPGIVRKDG